MDDSRISKKSLCFFLHESGRLLPNPSLVLPNSRFMTFEATIAEWSTCFNQDAATDFREKKGDISGL
jgi:hypothetical protein